MSRNPLKLYDHKGVTYCDGLFRLYDQCGIPLAVSLSECARRGWHACLLQFRDDARRAGWSPQRVERTCAEAIADSGYAVRS